MAFTAMKVTEQNLETVEQFDSDEIQQHRGWFNAVLDLATRSKTDYYIVQSYAFISMGFVRISFTVIAEPHFSNSYVIVEPDKPGFVQAVPRDDAEDFLA